MSLRDIDVRILGALLEKERTTPDTYPLSINTLVLACNQKTNRDPVTDYHQRDIEDALQMLRDRGLTRSRRSDSERVVKHEHRLDEVFDLGQREIAVLAVLMLRGRQTPGELRSRTERYVEFPDLTAVGTALERLAAHRPSLVENHGRGPGQSQDRWMHTLGPDPDKLRPRVRQAPGASVQTAAEAVVPGERTDTDEDALRREVRELRADLDRVLDTLGMERNRDAES